MIGEDGKEVVGEGEGELVVVGEGVAGGYWGDEEETKKRFISLDPLLFPSLSSPSFSFLSSPSSSPSPPLPIIGFRTGDLGRKYSDDMYHFLGRMTSQIKVRGFRVNLSQVEETLRGCGGVREVAVCAFSLSEKNSSSCPLLPGTTDADRLRIAAFVTKKEEEEGKTKDIEEKEEEKEKEEKGKEKLLLQRKVKKYAKKNLPGFMVPQLVVCLDLFPRGLTGKVDQKGLVSLAREQSLREREKGSEGKKGGEEGEGEEETFFVMVFRFLMSQVTSNRCWLSTSPSSTSSLLPSNRPLAELGVDSMDAMALKHRFMAWVRQHKNQVFVCLFVLFVTAYCQEGMMLLPLYVFFHSSF